MVYVLLFDDFWIFSNLLYWLDLYMKLIRCANAWCNTQLLLDVIDLDRNGNSCKGVTSFKDQKEDLFEGWSKI